MSRTTTTTTRGRPGRRGRGANVRIYGGFLDWILVMLAQEFLAPWLVGFLVLPAVGQLAHVAFGGSWWAWPILALVFVFAGPLPIPLRRQAQATKHTHRVVFGRRVEGCPRCAELDAGQQTPTQWKILWAGLGPWTYGEAAPRGRYGRWRAAISAVFALDSVAITQLIGIIHWRGIGDATRPQWPTYWEVPWAGIVAVFSFLVCFSWNLRRTEAVRGDGEDNRGQEEPSELQTVFKTKRPPKIVSTQEIHPGVMEVEIYHKGDPTEVIQAGIPALVSEYDLPREGHQAVPSKRGAAYTTITTVSWPMLDTPFPWPGPSAPGASIDIPCRVGVTQDGRPLEIARAGTPKPKRKGEPPKRNTTNVLIMGTTGAGKTEGELEEFADSITRVDVVWWWVDTVKGGQTADDIRPAVDWLATSEHEALAMIASLRHVIAYRAKRLRQLGLREWDRTAWERARIPFLIVHIEEFNAVAELFDTEIVRRSEQVRSVGISLSASSTRASAENMRTGMRAQLGTGWCFGVKDASDVDFALSESTRKAGANPGLWVNREPGKCYLEAIHIDPNRWAIPGRTYDPIDPAVLRQHVALWVPRMATMDPGSAQAAGDAYALRAKSDLGRWIEENGVRLPIPHQALPATPPMGLPIVSTASPAVAPQPPAEQEHVPMSQTEIEQMTKRMDREEVEAEVKTWRDPDIAGDMDAADREQAAAPVDPAADLPYGGGDFPEPRPMTPAEASGALVDAFRKRFERAGMPDFLDLSTAEMAEDWANTGVFGRLPDGTPANPPNRAALSGRLEKLRKQGLVQRIDPPEGEKAARGRKPAVWRIHRAVLGQPGQAPADSEPESLDE